MMFDEFLERWAALGGDDAAAAAAAAAVERELALAPDCLRRILFGN